MKEQKTDLAIVLRRINYGEKDRVVNLLCKDAGILSVFAKSVRSARSKLASGIELFNVVEVGYYDGKSNLKTLTGTRIIEFNDQIVENYERTNLCFQALKQLSKILEEAEGQEYFEPLRIYLRSMNNDALDMYIIHAWFVLKILTLSGVLSEFEVTGEGVKKHFNFDFDEQKFYESDSGIFGKDDIKLIRLMSVSEKPPMLKKALGSEQGVMNFAIKLAEFNLG